MNTRYVPGLLLMLCGIASQSITLPVLAEETINDTASALTAPEITSETDNLVLPKRSANASRKANPFPAKSWYVPPPPPPPAPPPPPTAPPLPYTYVGKILEPQGKLTIFIARGETMHMVKPGETLDGIYSVDTIDNGRLTLTYLPLNIKQYIPLGESR